MNSIANHIVVDIDPVLVALGPLQVRWYGLMYVVGFLIGGFLLAYLSKRRYFQVPTKRIDAYITYLLVGMFIGARLTYVFIYNWDYYGNNLVDILAVWKGGLSFHGALIGLLVATWLFARKEKRPFFEVADSMALAGAQGLFWGRMGNFINGELYGRTTDAAWGMIFRDGGPYPRHPSQLYEGILEGIVLTLVLWAIKRWTRTHGVISAAFLLFYGLFRFSVEFFREPDAQLGFYFGSVTMGQLLCALMVIGAGVMYMWAKRQRVPVNVVR